MSDEETGRREAMAAVKAMFQRYRLLAAERPAGHLDFDSQVMDFLELLDAESDGSVTFKLHMCQNFSNLNNVMHGGAAGVIFDMSTTSALCPIARPGSWEFMGGVTRTLNISYLKAVPLNIDVLLKSKVVSVGKQMAMIRGVMTSMDEKITYCTVEHHKVNAPVLPHMRGVRIPWDDDFDKKWGSGKFANKSNNKGVSSKI